MLDRLIAAFLPLPVYARRKISFPGVPAVIYSVGDVHGCLKNLIILDREIQSDSLNFQGPKVVVYHGDYIDRGPHSAHVIEYLCRKQALPGPPGVYWQFLAGNHEEMLLSFLDSVGRHDMWLKYGGYETLHSYGIETRNRRPKELAREALAKIPLAHVEFIRSLPSALRFGSHWFVHGFVDPNRSFERQRERTLLWGRPTDFPWPDHSLGFTVIHGHTPVAQVDIKHDRINIDTGAFFTGVLSGIRIRSDSVTILRASA